MNVPPAVRAWHEIAAALDPAALVVLGPTLRYVQQWHGERSAVLEFEADLDGAFVQGVDMPRWDEHDRLSEFTVIVRPLRGLQALIGRMGAQLQPAG